MGGGGSNVGPILDDNGQPIDPKSEEYKKIKDARLKHIQEEKVKLET